MGVIFQAAKFVTEIYISFRDTGDFSTRSDCGNGRILRFPGQDITFFLFTIRIGIKAWQTLSFFEGDRTARQCVIGRFSGQIKSGAGITEEKCYAIFGYNRIRGNDSIWFCVFVSYPAIPITFIVDHLVFPLRVFVILPSIMGTVGRLRITKNRRVGNTLCRAKILHGTAMYLTSRNSVFKVQKTAVFVKNPASVIDVLERNSVIVGADPIDEIEKIPLGD